MILGTFPIQSFDYDEVHRFARRAIEGIEEAGIDVPHLATTLQGVGFGLDAGESAQSLVLGFLEGLRAVQRSSVKRISIVERNDRLVRVIHDSLEQVGIGVHIVGEARRVPGSSSVSITPDLEGSTLEATSPSSDKEHVFVAIPFAPEFEDVYEFGIYGPVRRGGLVCERVDQASFTGDILTKIKERIATAKFVVADLTLARPNVYLEVGYAWGKEVPVVFLARSDESLHFDVRTQRCIIYGTIGQLARDLERLIAGLYPRRDEHSRAREDIEIRRRLGSLEKLLRFRDGVAILDLPISMSDRISDTVLSGIDAVDPGRFRGLIINVRNVGTMNSTALGELVRLWGSLNTRGRRAVVVAPNPSDEALTTLITKMIRPSDLFPSEEAALEGIRKIK